MDTDEVLRKIRHSIKMARASKPGDEAVEHEYLYVAVGLFADLDNHLSNGGAPPEAWREGPDAPEMDSDPSWMDRPHVFAPSRTIRNPNGWCVCGRMHGASLHVQDDMDEQRLDEEPEQDPPTTAVCRNCGMGIVHDPADGMWLSIGNRDWLCTAFHQARGHLPRP